MSKQRYENFVKSAEEELRDVRQDISVPVLRAICYALLGIGAAIKEAGEKKKPDNQEVS